MIHIPVVSRAFTISRTEVFSSQPSCNGYEAADPRHFFPVSWSVVARHVLHGFARISETTTCWLPVLLLQSEKYLRESVFLFFDV